MGMAKAKFKLVGKPSLGGLMPKMPMKPGGNMAPPMKYPPESPPIPLATAKKRPAVKFKVSRASR